MSSSNSSNGTPPLSEQMLAFLASEDSCDQVQDPSTDSLFAIMDPTLAKIILSLVISRIDCVYHPPPDRDATPQVRPSRHRRSQQSTPKPKPKPKHKLRIMSPRCQIDEMMNGDLYQTILDALPESQKELVVQIKEKWSTASAALGNCDGGNATTPKKSRDASISYCKVAIIKGFYAVVSAFVVDIYKYLPPTTAPFVDEMENRFKRVKAAATDFLQLRTMYEVVPTTITSNGNFSDVYKGRERGGLGRAVCIKMLKLIPGQQDIKDIKNEEGMAKCMSSPLFAKLLHSSSNDFIPFMVSEFLHGGELADYVKSVSLKQRLEDLPKLLRRVGACLLQLAVMEYVHRDIKDENMAFRGEAGNFDELVAFDLGLGRETTRSSDTYCGTGEFIAPEIERAGGEKGIKLTPAVDMFSAMVTVVRFIVREEGLKELERNPKTEAYDLDDVRTLLADHHVPEKFISLVCKGLTSKPTSRLTALQLHKHESLFGVPDPFDCQDLNPLKWVVALAETKALNEEFKKKSESDTETIAELTKENSKGQKRIAKLEVQLDKLQSSAPSNGTVEAVAAATAGTGANDASFFAKVPLLRDTYNGVSKDLTASAEATATRTGSATVDVARSAVKNEMLRRLRGAQCPITPADIDRFFCLGNPIPEGKRVGPSFSRENPLPSEIPTEDRIDNELTVTDTRGLLVSMGMKRGQDDPKEVLKNIVRPWWDSETDGDEEGTSSETEDDVASA